MKICRAWKKNFGGRRRSNYNGRRTEEIGRTLLESLESVKGSRDYDLGELGELLLQLK